MSGQQNDRAQPDELNIDVQQAHKREDFVYSPPPNGVLLSPEGWAKGKRHANGSPVMPFHDGGSAEKPPSHLSAESPPGSALPSPATGASRRLSVGRRSSVAGSGHSSRRASVLSRHSSHHEDRRESALAELQEKLGDLEEIKVPTWFYSKEIKRRIQTGRLYWQLIVYIPFVVLFILSSLSERDISNDYFLVRSMQDQLTGNEIPGLDVEKFWPDIAQPGDWYDWFEGVLIPALWDSSQPDTSIPMRYAQGENVVMGAVRTRVLRVMNNSCEFNPFLYPEDSGIPKICYGTYSEAKESREKYGRWMWLNPDTDQVDGTETTGDITRYHPGGYTQIFPINMTYNNAIAMIKMLRDEKWVEGLAVRFVITEFFIYAPNFDRFHSIKLFHEVMAGGSWIPNVQFRVFHVFRYFTWHTALRAVFTLYVGYYIIKMIYEWAVLWRETNFFFSWILKLWNMVEVVNLTFFVIAIVLNVLWMAESLNWPEWKLPGTAEYPGKLEGVLWYFSFQVYFNAVNTILTFLKVLKFVQLNDRLNVLTRTLEACQRNVINALLLASYLTVAFAMTGTAIFGNGLYEWRNFNTAFSTIMRMLVGDFQYEDMRNEQQVLAPFFFWSCFVLILFLMWSAIIIAIVSEGFAEVSNKQSNVALDVLIVRTLEKIWKFFRNLKFLEKKFWQGNNEEETLLQLSNLLLAEANQRFMEGHNDAESYLTYDGIPKLVPAELYNQLGEDTLDDLWADVLYEWHLYLQTHNKIQLESDHMMITEAVIHEVTSSNATIDDMNSTINVLEQKVRMMIDHLKREDDREQ